MRTRTQTRSRRRPARGTRTIVRNRSQARLAARNGSGSRRRHTRLARRTEAPVIVTGRRNGLAGTNGDQPRAPAEMDRSDPRFKAAVRDFAAATRLFQKQNYAKAQELFEKLASSPAHELAVRARVHLALCRQKRARSAPAPKTAEENYNLGVAELNARHLESATEHLSKADKDSEEREHVKYALAATHALQGNIDLALDYLKAAIALRPGNRYLARSDGDFEALTADPRFKSLVSPENGRDASFAS